MLNPNYILGKKEGEDKMNNKCKNQENKSNILINKNVKNIQENKKIKENIKEKAKNTDIILKDNKISYDNEKIMKKIDEFDERLYKNVLFNNYNCNNKRNINSNLKKNKEIKISYIEKIEQDKNNCLEENDLNFKINYENILKNNLVVINSDKNKDIDHLRKSSEIVSGKANNEKNEFLTNYNKHSNSNKIDDQLLDNLFPYSKDILSNKNEKNNYFKNNFHINNLLSNRLESPSRLVLNIYQNKKNQDTTNNQGTYEKIKIIEKENNLHIKNILDNSLEVRYNYDINNDVYKIIIKI
jgi:hypothetical protein